VEYVVAIIQSGHAIKSKKEQIKENYRSPNTKAAKMISIDLSELGYAAEE
jgi:hypothetical protein